MAKVVMLATHCDLEQPENGTSSGVERVSECTSEARRVERANKRVDERVAQE